MTLTTIAVICVLVVAVLARRLRGQAVPTPKKLFLLPVVVCCIGLESASHTRFNTVDIAVVAVGCAVSLGLGLLRGRMDKVSSVEGMPWVQWGAASVAVFAVNVAAKVAIDGAGLAVGGTSAALGSSLVLSFGLTFLGEAAVIWWRTQNGASGNTAPVARYRGAVQPSGRPTLWPPIR